MPSSHLKVPKLIHVRGVCFTIIKPPLYWTENGFGELSCDRCQQPLRVSFAARENPALAKADPRWMVPTTLSCACPSPPKVRLLERPKFPFHPMRDQRQLELQL